jgi:hypothetical protein
MKYLIFFPWLFVWISGCYEPGAQSSSDTRKKKTTPFLFKETIVTGKDSGMKSLSRFHNSDIADVLCQHWESSESYDEIPEDQLSELAIFKDSSVLENPRSHLRTGRWRVLMINRQPVLELYFTGGSKEQYFINRIQSTQLQLAGNDTKHAVQVQLISDGLIHQNMYSDPFHPVNNQWRIAPQKPESDSAIKERVKQCVRFYALYYRDNIRRQKTVISFTGLPRIFEWYRRGIGLPDRKEIDPGWVHCFYDRDQSLKGYDILRKLIVDYEFNWPRGAPTWVHETHSVLEQMYHKL